MYGRNINFTLLAPSLWAVVEAIATNVEEEKYMKQTYTTNQLHKISGKCYDGLKSYIRST